LQIWILPEQKGLKPAYAEKSATDMPDGKFNLVAAKAGRDGSMAINQDVELYLAKLRKEDKASHVLRPSRHAWVHVAEGEVNLNGEVLKEGDGAAVSDE